MNMLMLILEKPNNRKKPNSMGRKELARWRENSLSPSGRNNGSWAHKLNKWALRKANGPKGAQRKK